ncbi:hypothetical protein [Gimesia sp.]|uniref:hypothetical protein n=1 Tax=Gimesia sp. TaxID=2024833 RepID=UPI000C6B2099|nr:hypothetical protein [Gimesia sp.]MAX38870.1 DUF4832 domain-containing protein [Gimesia sp.]HAH44926.1 DUF4832 domain-containing protein [Planctomycetaceae bacterium]|tara:strand:+ start:2578 stop:3777 length:1200 start_codon:yes stop_codon:yes gene_type:complete
MSLDLAADELRPQRLQSNIVNVQPMTGIVLWSTNEAASTAPIQLEFAYLKYNQVVQEKGKYNWQPVESLLDEIAGRKHQAILRWHDTYVGESTGAPAFIKALPNYREITEKSENKLTGFPDWSNQEWQAFVLEFYTRFAEKYDRDPRLAFVQAGFGLWAEYHIYDGPMKPGETFPDKDFQLAFSKHLTSQFRETPWMISVDAAGDHTPFAKETVLSELSFGLFDDSFNHRRHKKENEPNWRTLGRDRWKHAPTGGEFSFFKKKDQQEALAPQGPYGIAFAEQAAKFHVSFIIGDDQPRYRNAEVIRQAGMDCGYRFKINRFVASSTASELEIENTGIAPIYFNAFPAIDGVRSEKSLKGLLPGESRHFRIAKGGRAPILTIDCDRLVPGQKIEYIADLH